MSSETETAEGAHRTDSLAASVAILLLLTVVQRVVGLVRSVLFCRWLDADQLGQWDLAFGFLMLAAPLAMLGIPGSFGRYVEHYRQQGQLRTFLRRTTLVSGVMGLLAVLVVFIRPVWFSDLIFGRSNQLMLVAIVAGTLATVIVFNYLVTLFTAMRQFRVVSAMQFSNTVLFAGIALGLLTTFPPRAESVVLAFGLACLFSAAFAIWRLLPMWQTLPVAGTPLPQRTLWSKLLPFAFWLWMMNWISNVFEIVDRFMIVHYSGLNDTAALDLVGQYHSARVIPVLFIGVAELLTGMVTPYLIADWEAGRREVVSQRLNTIVKLFGFSLVVGAAVILAVAPFLFGTVFKHKFAGGLDVLPFAMAACIWTSMNSVMNNYLWCAEKSHHLSVTLGAGLALNIVLNLLLLPLLGLQGVALACCASKALTLGLLWWICSKYDWRAEPGLVATAALPLLLPLGPVVTLVFTLIVMSGALRSVPFLRADERAMITDAVRMGWGRVKGRIARREQAAI